MTYAVGICLEVLRKTAKTVGQCCRSAVMELKSGRSACSAFGLKHEATGAAVIQTARLIRREFAEMSCCMPFSASDDLSEHPVPVCWVKKREGNKHGKWIMKREA